MASPFTDGELRDLLAHRRLGRLATAGPDDMPHVVPVRWRRDRRRAQCSRTSWMRLKSARRRRPASEIDETATSDERGGFTQPGFRCPGLWCDGKAATRGDEQRGGHVVSRGARVRPCRFGDR